VLFRYSDERRESMEQEIIREIAERRARRAFDASPIAQAVLRRALDAAVLAPSCANRQSWRFLVATEKAALDLIAPHLTEGNYWVKKAPALVLALTNPSFGCMQDDRREYALFDTGMACMNLMLQATREGLIAHPIAGFSPIPIKEALGIPESLILITIIALGYPGSKSGLNEKHLAQEDAPRIRRELEKTVCFNEWSLAEA
jgi:nitroreductase